jgi:hypothetical protein
MTSAGHATLALPAISTAVLESLYQHRLLSTSQIHALHTRQASLRWTRRLLAALTEHELIAAAPGPGRGRLWFLTKDGCDAVERIATRAEPRRPKVTPAQAAGPLRAHTLAVNDVAIAFVKAAREQGDDCGPLSWRHEIAHPTSSRRRKELLIADALLTYTQQLPDRTLAVHRRFIELDRATIPVDALAAKLDRYTTLHRHHHPEGAVEPAWRTHYPEFPGVLVALTAPGTTRRAALERRLRHIITLRPTRQPGGVQIQLVLLDDLFAHGPFAPIFIDPDRPERYRDWLGNPTS